MTLIILDAIKARASTQSFSRGEDYYHYGMVSDTVCRGDVLVGQCEGSSYEPYRVSAKISVAGEIVEAYCTCPYDWGGDCKHIVALLLTYLYKPMAFEYCPSNKDVLAALTKDQLVDMIDQMVLFYPELQHIIDEHS